MKEMSFIDHLEELRTRIIRIIVILFISFSFCYSFSSEISEFLLVPLRASLGSQGKVIFTGLLDKIMAELQIAFWSSILLGSPLWFREVWLFIRPGLYEEEVKVIRPFIFVGFFLFIVGGLFGYYVIFPFTFSTLLNYGMTDIEAMLSVTDYLLLASQVLVFLGILFQLPNAMLILGFMGVVTKYSLSSWRRYMAVIFAVMSALLTPPDPLSMMVVWVPMMILYEIGILGVALIVHPYLHKKTMGEDYPTSS